MLIECSIILKCFPVIVQLRPTYTEEQFLAQAKKQFLAGYQLAYIEANNKVSAVAGYRYLETLAWGKFLYVDDLITDATSRSHGLGKQLLNWLMDEAKKQDCQQLHLDSGVQRLDAHRFYQRENLSFSSQHYAIELK